MLGYLRAREARPASRSRMVLKTLSQMAVFWFVFLYLLPAGIVALEQAFGWSVDWFHSSINIWCGGLLFVFGGALGLTSAMIMAVWGRGTPMPTDCARELVVRGPYRYIRNPMAIAGLAQGVAVGLIVGSPAVIAYGLVGGPIWHYFVRPWEEADLLRRFGEPYQRYRAEVRCWLPRLTGYRPLGNPYQAELAR